MGLDFIRGKSGRPYTKRWSQGVDRLKRPTLFDGKLSPESRIVTAALAPGCKPSPGDAYLVQTTPGGDLIVLDGHRQVAKIANPPPDIAQAITAQHGVAPATVERVGRFGTTAELKLQ
jgi:hypothetical protein